MNSLQKTVLIALFISLFFSGYSQSATSSGVEIVKDHSALIDVFGQEWVDHNPTLVLAFENCRQNRISFVNETLTDFDKYPRLSSFPLMTKKNPNVTGVDFSNFNPVTFNPFTYNIEFFSSALQAIRIDGTEWVMIILPEKH